MNRKIMTTNIKNMIIKQTVRIAVTYAERHNERQLNVYRVFNI